MYNLSPLSEILSENNHIRKLTNFYLFIYLFFISNSISLKSAKRTSFLLSFSMINREWVFSQSFIWVELCCRLARVSMQIFVLFFLVLDLLGVFFSIFSMYLGCPPCAYIEFPLLIYIYKRSTKGHNNSSHEAYKRSLLSGEKDEQKF